MTQLHRYNRVQARVARFSSRSIPLRLKSPAIVQAQAENPIIAFVHELAERTAASANPLNELLPEIVRFVGDVVRFDACFVYVVEDGRWVLQCSTKASVEALQELKLYIGDALLSAPGQTSHADYYF